PAGAVSGRCRPGLVRCRGNAPAARPGRRAGGDQMPGVLVPACLERRNAGAAGSARGYVMDPGTLCRLAAHWYDGRLDRGYVAQIAGRGGRLSARGRAVRALLGTVTVTRAQVSASSARFAWSGRGAGIIQRG